MIFRLYIKALAIFSALLALGAPAAAATLDQSFSINSQIIPRSNSTYATVDLHTQTVDRFDTSLGTLESVTLSFDLTFDGGIALGYYNDTSQSGYPKYTDGTIVYQLRDTIADNRVREAVHVSGSTTSDKQLVGTLSYGNNSYFEKTASVSDRELWILPYIDAYNAPADRQVFFRTVGDGLFVSGTATLRYEYTPVSAVPLPASGFLLLAGLTGLVFQRRRKA
ncbi:VPLPA-CTERM sorting domain-containing protein [Roseovarius spongiae]|nr:VPLPA-CTERM sorting domain-containing protein [Roseovarius spongiae]